MKRRKFLEIIGLAVTSPAIMQRLFASIDEHKALLDALPDATLKRGDNGEDVKALEAVLLARKFHLPGRERGATGKFDVPLEKLLSDYQAILEEKGFLEPGSYTPGEYTPLTRDAIRKDFAQRHQVQQEKLVRYDCGEQHENLRIMQQNMQPMEFFPQTVRANGYYGAATELAVLKFQKAAQALGLLGEEDIHGIYTQETQDVYRTNDELVAAMHAALELEKHKDQLSLSPNAQGDTVKIAERMLFYRGFRFGRGSKDFSPKGEFDEKMQTSLHRYQAILMKKDLLSDTGITGEIDENTLNAAKQDLQQLSQVLTKNNGQIKFRRGASERGVLDYQGMLMEAGVYSKEWHTPNAVYGPYTELATLELQGLLAETGKLPPEEIHGICTQATYEALQAYLRNPEARVERPKVEDSTATTTSTDTTRASTAPAKTTEKKLTVVLDPGHGTWNISPTRGTPYDSFDVGAPVTGKKIPGITYEYQAIELFTADLIKAFEQYPGVELKLTRDITKESEPERRKKSNARRKFTSRTKFTGEIFLSVHFNSKPDNKNVHGPRLYLHGDEPYRAVGTNGNPLKTPSDRFGKTLQDALGIKLLQEHRLDILAPIYQDRNRVASLLLEAGFLSNAEDVKKLADPQWRKETAEKVAEATIQFAIEEKLAQENHLRMPQLPEAKALPLPEELPMRPPETTFLEEILNPSPPSSPDSLRR